MNLKMLATFAVAYVAVNVVNTVLTLVYALVAHTPSATQLGVDYLHDPAYQATVPVHVVINVIGWAAAGGLYFWLRRPEPAALGDAVGAGIAWAALTMAVDFVLYVLILGNTQWGLPAASFYIGNQPWITLTYVAVLVGPLLARYAAALRRAS